MQKHITKTITIPLLFFCNTVLLGTLRTPTTTFIGANSSDLSVAQVWNYIEHIKQPMRSTYTLTVGTARSSRPQTINNLLFGNMCLQNGATLMVTGSSVPSLHRTTDLLADDYGLPTDFSSAIYTEPRIKNSQIAFTAYADLSRFIPHLYLQVEAPYHYTNWDIKLTEKIITPGTNDYVPSAIYPDGIARSALLNSFSDYITGTAKPAIASITTQKLNYAQIKPCGGNRHSFCAINFVLGYDFYATSCAAVTLSGRGAIPCGTRPNGTYLFEPIIGNGHHGQLGIGITAYWRHYLDQCENESFLVYIDGSADHLFKTDQRRTFDLVKKPLSRYLLAIKRPSTQNPIAEISPVANLTTLSTEVSIACRGQLTLMLAYEKKAWSWLFGYHLLLQSPEKVIPCESLPFSTSTTASNPTTYREYWALLQSPTVPLTAEDIDLRSSSSKKVLNTLFSQVFYTGCDRTYITPFAGFGGSVQLGQSGAVSPAQKTGSLNSALSAWGIWLNLGFYCN